jgi:hypothetical protein
VIGTGGECAYGRRDGDDQDRSTHAYLARTLSVILPGPRVLRRLSDAGVSSADGQIGVL